VKPLIIRKKHLTRCHKKKKKKKRLRRPKKGRPRTPPKEGELAAQGTRNDGRGKRGLARGGGLLYEGKSLEGEKKGRAANPTPQKGAAFAPTPGGKRAGGGVTEGKKKGAGTWIGPIRRKEGEKNAVLSRLERVKKNNQRKRREGGKPDPLASPPSKGNREEGDPAPSRRGKLTKTKKKESPSSYRLKGGKKTGGHCPFRCCEATFKNGKGKKRGPAALTARKRDSREKRPIREPSRPRPTGERKPLQFLKKKRGQPQMPNCEKGTHE